MFFIFIIIVSLLVAIWLFIIVLVTNLIKEYAELLNESFIAVLHFSLSLSTIFLVILSIKSPILEILFLILLFLILFYVIGINTK